MALNCFVTYDSGSKWINNKSILLDSYILRNQKSNNIGRNNCRSSQKELITTKNWKRRDESNNSSNSILIQKSLDQIDNNRRDNHNKIFVCQLQKGKWKRISSNVYVGY